VLTTHPLLALRSGKSRAIPVPPLWAFGPVTGYLYLLQNAITSANCPEKGITAKYVKMVE
jgi:hypothetical protein